MPEWPSGFPYFLQFNPNFAIRSWWSEPHSAPDLVSADCIELLHLWLQRKLIYLISLLTICWCPCVESTHGCGKRVFSTTSVLSWQNSISLCPASFCTPRPNLPVTPVISWLPIFAFQSLIWKGHLFWVLVLKGLIFLHRTIQLQLLQHYWFGYRLGLLWYWMVCLGNEQSSFCPFWDCIQVLYFRLFCGPWWVLHFF